MAPALLNQIANPTTLLDQYRRRLRARIQP